MKHVSSDNNILMVNENIDGTVTLSLKTDVQTYISLEIFQMYILIGLLL